MKQDKSKKSSSSVLEVSMRAKALYLSTLPVIDESLVREYLGIIYPNEKATYEKVVPVANLILLKYIWWYLKLFKNDISDNKNKLNLFQSSLYQLFENNFKFSPEEILNRVNKEIPDEVFETNWFEREIVNSVGKNEFGVLESISAISIENHLEQAMKIWNGVWRLTNETLVDVTRNLVRATLEDYAGKVKNQ